MIRRIRVSNYRSLGPDIDLRVGDFCLLVGPNGAGKSNLLDVLSFTRDAISQGLSAAVTHRGGIDNVRRHSRGHPYNVTIDLGLSLSADTWASYTFTLAGDSKHEYRVCKEHAQVGEHAFTRTDREGETRFPDGLAPRTDPTSLALSLLGGDERFEALFEALSNVMVYSIFPDVLRQPQRFDPSHPMRRHGENWVSTLRALTGDGRRDEKAASLTALRKLTGDVEDVRVTGAAGFLVAEFKHTRQGKRRRWFDAAQQSDGTLRVAGLLTALQQRPAVAVIGIEEPELTVHPGALPMIYDHLREAREVSQLFVTTHSPEILDEVDVRSEDLFVVERREGVTQIRQAGELELRPVRERLLTLGEYFHSGGLQLSLFSSGEDAATAPPLEETSADAAADPTPQETSADNLPTSEAS